MNVGSSYLRKIAEHCVNKMTMKTETPPHEGVRRDHAEGCWKARRAVRNISLVPLVASSDISLRATITVYSDAGETAITTFGEGALSLSPRRTNRKDVSSFREQRSRNVLDYSAQRTWRCFRLVSPISGERSLVPS